MFTFCALTCKCDLFGRRVFAYIIRDLKVRSPWIIQVGHPMTSVVQGTKEEKTQKERRPRANAGRARHTGA